MVAKTFSIQHHDKDKTQYYQSQAKKGKLTSESNSDGDKDDSYSKASNNSATVKARSSKKYFIEEMEVEDLRLPRKSNTQKSNTLEVFCDPPPEKQGSFRLDKSTSLRRMTTISDPKYFAGLAENKIERGNIDFRRLVKYQRNALIGVKPKK